MILLTVGYFVAGVLAWAAAAGNYREAEQLKRDAQDLLAQETAMRARLDAKILELRQLEARAAEADRAAAVADFEATWKRWKGARP